MVIFKKNRGEIVVEFIINEQHDVNSYRYCPINSNSLLYSHNLVKGI